MMPSLSDRNLDIALQLLDGKFARELAMKHDISDTSITQILKGVVAQLCPELYKDAEARHQHNKLRFFRMNKSKITDEIHNLMRERGCDVACKESVNYNGLIIKTHITDPDTLDDLMLCIARTIEDSLLKSGAIPGKDYTMLDLYKLAQPFAVDIFSRNHEGENPISFTIAWQ